MVQVLKFTTIKYSKTITLTYVHETSAFISKAGKKMLLLLQPADNYDGRIEKLNIAGINFLEISSKHPLDNYDKVRVLFEFCNNSHVMKSYVRLAKKNKKQMISILEEHIILDCANTIASYCFRNNI